MTRIAAWRSQLMATPFRRALAVSFALCVILPGLAALSYALVLARPVYVSESRFVVRGQTERLPGAEALGAPGTAAGALAALNVPQDAYMLSRFVTSPALAEALAADHALDAAYAADGRDPLQGLSPETGSSARARLWARMASAEVDPISGIVTLKVRAFDPETARRLNQASLSAAETMLNAMLGAARQQARTSAEAERDTALQRLAAVQTEIEAFRMASGVLDPEGAAARQLELIVNLRRQRISAAAEYAGARASLGPQAPQLLAIKARIDALDAQIAELNRTLAGAAGLEGQTLPDLLISYEALQTKRDFAARRVALAELALARAESEVVRWRVHAEVFVPAHLAQEAAAPRPFAWTLATLAACFAVWSLGALAAANTLDRRA